MHDILTTIRLSWRPSSAVISFIFSKLEKKMKMKTAKKAKTGDTCNSRGRRRRSRKQTAQHRPAKNMEQAAGKRQLQRAQIWKQSSAESKKMRSVIHAGR